MQTLQMAMVLANLLLKECNLAKLLTVFSKFSNVLVYSISHHNNSTCIINSVAS